MISDESPYEQVALIPAVNGFWKARKRGTTRPVLLEIRAGDEEQLSRHLDILYSCSHPCILEFFGAWVSGSQLHFVLEYSQGTLESLNLTRLVHRHIRLDSVWLTPDGQPKLGQLSHAEQLPAAGVLDLALHYSPWLPPEMLPGSGLFGVDLDALYEYHAFSGAMRLVYASCRLLHSHQDEPGLFRISANHSDVQKLRVAFACMHRLRLHKMFEQRKSANAWNVTAPDPSADALLVAAGPHAAASLLVSFLMDLPEALVPSVLHDQVLAACESSSTAQDLAPLLRSLSRPHSALLKCVLQLLSSVAINSDRNQMTSQNLGMVLAPSILRKSIAAGSTTEEVMRDAKRQGRAVAVMIDLQSQLSDALDDDFSSDVDAELPLDEAAALPTIRSTPYGTEVDIWSVGVLARRLASSLPSNAATSASLESFLESSLHSSPRPTAEVLLRHPWLVGEAARISMPPSAESAPDLKAREGLEKSLVEADQLLKRYRAVARSPDADAASQLLAGVTARYRGVIAMLSSTVDFADLRQRAWFGLGRASVIAGALLEAEERLRLAASAAQPDARVLRHRALTLFRLAKKAEPGVQPLACLAESCRLYCASERLPPSFTARWLHRWARAVDMGCAINAPDSYTSRESWYRAFKMAAEQPNASLNLKPLIGFAAHSNSAFSRPMMLLSELSVRGGSSEIRRVAYSQSAALADLLYSQTTMPNAGAPLPSEQLKTIKALKLTEAEVRRNYQSFLIALSFGKQAEKVMMLGKLAQKEENPNNGPELLNEPQGDVVCEDALTETYESRFEGKELLGRGGFAMVYRAKRRSDGRVVAVKVLTSGAKNTIRAVLREAKLLRDLKHQNVVSFLGCVRLSAQAVMHVVMEFCDGGTLRALVSSTPVTSEQAAFLIREILSGLVYLHAANIIHRDIKCENILLHMNGDVKIGDFGIADSWGPDCQATEEDAGRIMKACGTPRYMSPEILRAQPCGRKMDLFSLAAVLYEVMEGESPYSDETVVRACFLTATRGFPPIECNCHPELKNFYRDISHLEPHKRPSAATALKHPFLRIAGTRDEIRQLFSIAFLTRSIAAAGL